MDWILDSNWWRKVRHYCKCFYDILLCKAFAFAIMSFQTEAGQTWSGWLCIASDIMDRRSQRIKAIWHHRGKQWPWITMKLRYPKWECYWKHFQFSGYRDNSVEFKTECWKLILFFVIHFFFIKVLSLISCLSIFTYYQMSSFKDKKLWWFYQLCLFMWN